MMIGCYIATGIKAANVSKIDVAVYNVKRFVDKKNSISWREHAEPW